MARLRFPKQMREGEGWLTYGVRVEAIKFGEWIPATVNGQIIQQMAPGEQESIRLSDEDGGQFYGYPDTVRMPS